MKYLPKEWKIKKLNEICLINPENLSNNLDSETILSYIDIESVISGRINNIKDIKFKEAPSRAKRIVRKNDVLISTVRPYLKAFAIVKEDLKSLICSTGFAVLRVKKGLNSHYIYQYFFTENILKQMLNKMVGSNYPAVNNKDIEDLSILLPPIKEQGRIASILSTVDEQIENTDKLINFYSFLKKGLVQTLLTKGIGHTEFKKTEIGEIPEEWDVKKLEELFSITAGRDLVKDAFSPIKDIEHSFPIYSNSLENKGVYGYTKIARYKENCITITARGTLGRANSRTTKFDAIGRLLVMEPVENLVCFFISEYINNRARFFIESTGVPQLTVPKASKCLVAFPSIKEQQKIASILSTVEDRIELYKLKNDKLKKLKIGLMQQLLTGKIRVKI